MFCFVLYQLSLCLIRMLRSLGMTHSVGTYIVFQDQASNYCVKKIEATGFVTDFIFYWCRNAKIGKMKIPWNLIAETPFGGTLRLERNVWSRTQRIKFGFIDEDESVFTEFGKDNRDLIDDNKAQALSTEEIKELRSSKDVSNADIIKTIAESSSTFASKTVFAQQKYIRKKQQKHLQQVTLFEPTPALIAKVTSSWSAGRACGLRTDTLGALLCLGNVRPGARVACLDHSQGILLGAAMQSACAAENGRVFALLTDQVRDKTTKQFNLGPEIESRLVAVPKSALFDPLFPSFLKNVHENPEGENANKYLTYLETDHIHFPSKPETDEEAALRRANQGVNPPHYKLNEKRASKSEENDDENQEVPSSKRVKLSTDSDDNEEKPVEEVKNSEDASWRDNMPFAERLEKWKQRRQTQLNAASSFAEGLDSIVGVIGTQRLVEGESVFNLATGLADAAIRALKSDGRIALLCAQMEPLSQLAARMLASRSFICVRLEEFLFREHQVLPMRTHPTMKADYRTFEGFILSAIRVNPIGGDDSQL